MSNLINNNPNVPQTPMEVLLGIDENGKTSARKLYEFLQHAQGQFSRWAKINIEENEFAVEGEDYIVFDTNVENPNGGRPGKDYMLQSHLAKKLAMQAHNERGEEARDYYISVEENSAALATSLGNLSPQLRHLISMELRITKVEEDSKKAIEQVDGMRNIIALNPTQWRKDGSDIINRIATNMGGNEHIKVVHNEVYDLLEQRFGVNLGTRLTYKRRRMAEEGVCKSRRDKLNQLDVIAEDKKLIEGWVLIVKELAIKYGVGA